MLQLRHHRSIVIAVVAMMSIFVGAMTAFAGTLDDYQERVKAVKTDVDTLYYDLNYEELEREDLGSVIGPIPARETIEWPNGTIETDNRWLHEQAKKLNAAENDQERGLILTEMSERLGSISDSIDRLKAAVEAERTKDEDKQKLAEILRREEYQKPAENEKSMIEQWIDDFLDWLFGAFPKPSVSPGETTGLGGLQLVLQILIYALVIGFIGFIVYKLAPHIFKRFERRGGDEKGHRVILGERIEADESASDLFGEAEQLAMNGDIRGAIRKGYIALLCELGDRKVIRLAHHKTNRDYLVDLRKTPPLFENVHVLTKEFERNWYGLQAADETDWQTFRANYQRTIADVKN